MAWLNATPEDEKKSRREQMIEGGESSPLLFLPPIYNLEYLIALWNDAGTVETSSGGIGRLSWLEINNWLEVRKKRNEADLQDWEIEVVRMLSEEYSSEYNLASDKNREPPYSEIDNSVEELNRVNVVNKLNSIFGTFVVVKENKSDTEEE